MYVAILHTDIPITPIKTVLEANQCPAKFVIKGRISKHLPSNIADFCRKHCRACKRAYDRHELQCSACKVPLHEWLFLFTIEVTDGVDSITLIVTDVEAVRFLNGLPPCNLAVNDDALAYVTNCMDRLGGSALPTSFCVKSYHLNNERRYRLFDTVLALH